MAAGTLIRIGGMADQHSGAIEIQLDIGDGSGAVVEALDLPEPEHLRDPVRRATRVFVREHRDDALLSHGQPPTAVRIT